MEKGKVPGKTLRRIKAIITFVLGIIFFVIGSTFVYKELKGFNVNEIITSIKEVPLWRFIASFVFAAASYLALAYSEWKILKLYKIDISLGQASLTSFVSTAVSNTLGFSAFTGTPIRDRFYLAENVSKDDISSTSWINSLFFWLGFVLLAGVIAIIQPLPVVKEWRLPIASMWPVGVFFLVIIGVFYIGAWKNFTIKIKSFRLTIPPVKFSTQALLVSAFEWLCSGLAVYILLPPQLGVFILYSIGIFLLARITGTGSQVPGGLGVFESIYIGLLGAGGHTPGVAGAVGVFRLIYFFFPFFIALIMWAIREIVVRIKTILRTSQSARDFFAPIAPYLYSFATFLGGATLLYSGVTPTSGSRMEWLNHIIPLSVVEVSHFLSSLVGAGLVFLAFGLQRRLDAAYRLTLGFMSIAIFLALLKGANYEISIALLIMLIALIPSRKYFYRKTVLTAEPFSKTWIIAITLVILSSIFLVIFSYRNTSVSKEMWWHFTLFGQAPRSVRALVGVVIIVCFFAIIKLFRSVPQKPFIPDQNSISKLSEIMQTSNETLPNLVYLKDKTVLLSDDEKAFIMYSVEKNSWIALGEPVGNDDVKVELIWKYRNLVERSHGWPVFYAIEEQNLHLYTDMVLTFSKMGEEGRTKLNTFEIGDAAYSKFRDAVQNLESEGYEFYVIPPRDVSTVLNELKKVSDDWLNSTNSCEKRFSRGYVNEDYLEMFPIAIVRKNNRIVAFANILRTVSNEELTVDLLRFSSNTPQTLMDYILVKVMLWGKEQGYEWFNLGMVPLAGFEKRGLSSLWKTLGTLIYHHYENFQDFQALRAYKERFNPVWAPKYLISPGGIALAHVLEHLTNLVACESGNHMNSSSKPSKAPAPGK